MTDTLTIDAPPDSAIPSKAVADFEALHAVIEQACGQACHAIAPAWPLDRAIAVNPHWSRISMPVRRVAARMACSVASRYFHREISNCERGAKGEFALPIWR